MLSLRGRDRTRGPMGEDTMTSFRFRTLTTPFVGFALLAAVAGCSGEASPTGAEAQPPGAAPAAESPRGPATGARAAADTGRGPSAASPSVALRIEQAERKLDVGGDAVAARTQLEEAAADPAATAEQRDQARLALSHALEAEGDQEGATAALEAILAAHSEDRQWPLEDVVEKRLRKLVTGTEDAPRRAPRDDDSVVAPFAGELAPYFPAQANGRTEISIFAFGGASDTSERLGTFNVAKAQREQKRAACPLCEEKTNINSGFSRSGGWLGIPRSRAHLGSALAVYYFDLGDDRIPARYDADLPLPSAEIAAHLERGEGLVAARERPGAPPSILIAAPRQAQLADVEEALAAMKSLPIEPVVVPVPASLKPQEIQFVVRGAHKAQVACYEALLGRVPGIAGKLALKFTVLPDGGVADSAIDTATSTMRDAEFERCMT
jgi:hypothetical protein